jgi:hypothetical protein
MNWEWFNTAAGAASLMGLILAVILGLVSWRISRATDRLIQQSHQDTRALINQTSANTQGILERMDQRADERQREIFQALQALKR